MKHPLFSPYQAENSCNLCGHREAWVIGVRDRLGKPLRTVLCQNCGLAWTDPQPSGEQIKTFYETEYRRQYKGSWRPKPKHAYRAGRVALERIHSLKNFIGSSGTLLDLGCGGGEFLYLLRQRGFDVEGVEPNQGYGEYARDELDLPVHVQFVTDEIPGDRLYDTITMFHVLEHLQTPSETVEAVARRLKPGGLFIIEVPNLKAHCHMPNNCWHFAHLFHFSAVTLELLGAAHGLERIASWTSDFGGNVTAVLRKGEGPTALPAAIAARENADHTFKLCKQHKVWKYFLRPMTYERLTRKYFSRWQERRAVQKMNHGKEALELLCPA